MSRWPVVHDAFISEKNMLRSDTLEDEWKHSWATSGHGVTANIPVLGTGDSGFESQCPDIQRKIPCESMVFSFVLRIYSLE